MKRWYANTLAILLVVSLFFIALYFENDLANEVRDRLVYNDLDLIEQRINNDLIQRVRLVDGLAAYVQTVQTTNKDILDTYISKLFSDEDPVIRNIAVLKGTTIEYQYPLKGNESSIGVDLSTIDGQRESLLNVMTSLTPSLNGPVDLVQGGKGLIVRVPIALEKGNPESYWGMISVVLDYEALINRVIDIEMSTKYLLSIERTDQFGALKEVVYQQGQVTDFRLKRDVAIVDSFWRISVQKTNQPFFSTTGVFLIILGMIMTSLVVWLVDKWMRYQYILNVEVATTTSELQQTNEILEQYIVEYQEKQAELTVVNSQLEESLDQLESTQEKLVLTEKLAALGDMVASLAHEINTPLGVCVTLNSFVSQNLNMLRPLSHRDNLDEIKGELTAYIEENSEALNLMASNLKRSSELVASFKLVAMDQYLEEYRVINLSSYLNEILNSLRPKFKRLDQMLVLDVDPTIKLYTFPGAISQIITNLITNSIIHGFEGEQNGIIKISAHESDDTHVSLVYKDNGVGIPEEIRSKVFTPFFTTKKQKGSTGLGMHIIYNAVVQTLEGQLDTLHDEGFGMVIQLPIQIEKDKLVP